LKIINNQNRKKFDKKAQVTAFIIIGLVILGTVGLFTYVINSTTKYKDTPNEYMPVVEYVDQCVRETTASGIFLLSLQGGYVELPEAISTNPESYIDMGFKVPYWYYKGQRRGPYIEMIEEDLAEYINQNLLICLDNLNSFRDQYTINEDISKTDITTEVLITVDDVYVETDLPLTLSTSDVISITLPLIQVETEYNIGQMLDLAFAIMNLEEEENFLEAYTDEIIASSDYLPYEGIEFSCEPKKWEIDDMEDYTKIILQHNLKYLMFENTEYEETDYDYYNELYKIKLNSEDYSNLKVETIYNPDWGLDLDVQPSSNGEVTDIDLLKNTFSIPCVKIYHHKYSTYYPVMFRITDEDYPDLSFYFATPVITRRNMPNRYSEIEPWPAETDTYVNKQYCNNETTITLYHIGDDGYIYTEETIAANWNYGVEVFVYDSLYGLDMPLSGVNISYRCVSFECDVGRTGLPIDEAGYYTGGMPSLNTEFPTCVNGYVIAEADGYKDAKIMQTVDSSTDGQSINIEMIKLMPFEFKVTVIEEHNGLISERELEKEESAVVTILSDDLDYDQYVIYNQNGTSENITLLAQETTYELEVQLTSDTEFLGLLQLNWTPTVSEIVTRDNLEFYVIKKDITAPNFVLDTEQYQEVYNYALEQSQYYEPKFG